MEIVENSFSLIKHEISRYYQLPVRYDVVLVSGNRKNRIPALYYSWRPVESWSEAGASVVFSDFPPVYNFNEILDRLRKEMLELRRPVEGGLSSGGFMQPPLFFGQRFDNPLMGETPVLYETSCWVKDTLKELFSEFSARDS